MTFRPRVVIDTNVFFEAFDRLVSADGRPDHPFLDVLDAVANEDCLPLWSAQTLDELKYMLYDSTDALKRNFRAHDPQDVVNLLVGYGEPVRIEGVVYTVGIDRDDDKFVETAIVGKAEYLVTGDYTHFHKADVRALLEEHGCSVVDAAGFVAIVGRTPEPTQ